MSKSTPRRNLQHLFSSFPFHVDLLMFVTCHIREKIALRPDAVVQPLHTTEASDKQHNSVREGTYLNPSVEALSPAVTEGILDTLSKKFVGTVLSNTGPVLFINRVTYVSALHIFPGTGASWCFVDFLATVFRPSVGIVLSGIIVDQKESGLRVDAGFYDDIHIPIEGLPHGAKFNTQTQRWSFSEPGKKDVELLLLGAVSLRVTTVDFSALEGGQNGSWANAVSTSVNEQRFSMQILGEFLPILV